MHLAIDASNIRQGGGVTHLSQLLGAVSPGEFGITHVTIWACSATSAQLPAKPWMTKISPAWTESGLFLRLLGQQFLLNREVVRCRCDVLFSPGGTVPFRASVPVVTMSQNMLPFDPEEALRFGRWSWMRIKMRLLRKTQGRSFRHADGIIFLTRYARERVFRVIGSVKGRAVIIPHGVEPRFSIYPRRQKDISEFSLQDPMKVLYVSILMPYKHQIEVAYAISELRSDGYAVQGKFIGGDWGAYGSQFRNTIKQLDPVAEFLTWSGEVPYSNLHEEYGAADVFVFASSCENLPNILIEAMAGGLPIACSNRGPMREVLGKNGLYFNPESPESITQSIRLLVEHTGLREKLAASAWKASHKYSWKRCARETFAFIASIASPKFKSLPYKNNSVGENPGGEGCQCKG